MNKSGPYHYLELNNCSSNYAISRKAVYASEYKETTEKKRNYFSKALQEFT